MSALKKKRDEAVLVLLGQFNPAIFQPAWFELHSLLRPEELKSCQVELIHPTLTKFSAAWLDVEVHQGRLRFGTTDATSVELLRDAALQVLKLLDHTPIQAVGVNRITHYAMPSRETWHEVGHTLVPKGPFEGLVEEPGMLELSIQGKRPGSGAKHMRIKLSPSPPQVHETGVAVDFNEHFEDKLSEAAAPMRGAEFAQDVLDSNWTEAQSYFVRTGEQLLEKLIP